MSPIVLLISLEATATGATIKTVLNETVVANTKTWNGITWASVKTVNDVDRV